MVLTRERSNPQEPVRDTPESGMRRIVPRPLDRTFTVSGTVRLDPDAPAEQLDAFLGRTDASLVVTSTGSLEGNLLAMPSAMLDGDPTTRFIGRFDDQVGQAWRIRSGTPFAVDEIELDIVVGPRQSVPTELVVTVDDVEAGRFPTGLSASDTERVETIVLPVNAESATTVRIEVAASADTLTRDWYSNAFISMPFAIAEMRVGELGLAAARPGRHSLVRRCCSHRRPRCAVRISGDLEAARRGEALSSWRAAPCRCQRAMFVSTRPAAAFR